MTLDELKKQLEKAGYGWKSVDIEYVGPDNEWTVAEQEEDCCAPVPDHDPCVEDGKIEPWSAMSDEIAH